MAHFETYKHPPDISPSVYKPTQKLYTEPRAYKRQLTVIGPWVHRFSKFLLLCFCLFVFCLLVVVVVVVFLLFFFCFCFLCISPSKSNPTSGKIKCVTFCCVTQTKQACKLSARNYRFEILQRIQIKKRRLIGENSFEVQIRKNHFIPEGSSF